VSRSIALEWSQSALTQRLVAVAQASLAFQRTTLLALGERATTLPGAVAALVVWLRSVLVLVLMLMLALASVERPVSK
jgi:hypothetical protein